MDLRAAASLDLEAAVATLQEQKAGSAGAIKTTHVQLMKAVDANPVGRSISHCRCGERRQAPFASARTLSFADALLSTRPLIGRPARTDPVLRGDSRRPEPRGTRGTACRDL